MGEALRGSPELPSLRDLHAELGGALRNNRKVVYRDARYLSRGYFTLDNYMDLVLTGTDEKHALERLTAGRAALNVQGTGPYEGMAVMLAYKADIDDASGYSFVAADAPDYEPGSPDEQPFVYYVGQSQELDADAKVHLLQEIHDTFRSYAK
ncbi:MAG TPA: hypothetical protein VLF43_01975 [Candidatus Saccharimonadales bacterium]|nr:hypothetical protein [Candidatus Saccharimonadales bacterium]